MERQLFTAQMLRLAETYGERAYPKERMNLLWNAFKDVSNDVFMDAVSELIVTQRSMPMLKEFDAAVETARRRAQDAARGFGSFASVLEDAGQRSKRARHDVVKFCIDAVKWKVANRIHHESQEWQDILGAIDRLVKSPEEAV